MFGSSIKFLKRSLRMKAIFKNWKGLKEKKMKMMAIVIMIMIMIMMTTKVIEIPW